LTHTHRQIKNTARKKKILFYFDNPVSPNFYILEAF
jgi:hypothetical protein